MENLHQFKLIEGVFLPEEAGKVLFTLIQDKIKYHNLDIVSTRIRKDMDDSHSESRISALNKVRNSVKEILEFANAIDVNVEVNGYFEIRLLK